jgi:hypothetical protein
MATMRNPQVDEDLHKRWSIIADEQMTLHIDTGHLRFHGSWPDDYPGK